MAILWIVVGAALVVAVSVFHSMNPQAVNLNMYGFPIFGVPMWMVVGVPAIVGLALGVLMDVPQRVRHAWHERKLGGVVRENEKTIAGLQSRITDLERDLAVARNAGTPVIIEEVREVPPGTLSESPMDAGLPVGLPRAV
ncbi:MAG TPA: hypothetical protein VNM48_21315 [Chloroflexota bacterium]|nr:hypothetical protein [Chloroflexota bacterium]